MAESLTYEQMLSALQGLIGRPVSVHVSVESEKDRYPIAIMTGTLRLGQETDLSHVGFPGGESILFYLEDDRRNESALRCFVIRPDGYKHGAREDNGDLSWHLGKARIAVAPNGEQSS